MTEEENLDLVETLDENGEPVTFQLIDIVEYEEKEYALLLPYDEENEDNEEEESEMVLMRLITENNEYSFETIDDEKEFNAVAAYIESFGDED